ncbi:MULTISPECIES: ABC transporter permease [Shewanella]|uniref:ABC transporter permease n=1 Tax=Shewanella TaxID=22 RepID=UPI001C660900|nr:MULTISPECIES: ABC transporter permease [Shewanella]QYJ75348.1 ABC transporter permease subunit [Shewanella sp. FJAT-52076]QYK05204.1 ABC transporter permease subunit [Shewanella zhangzhouensis]
MKRILTMLRKEFLDALRDKRSVMAGLYYAIGTPLIMSGLFMVLINQLSSPDDLFIKIENAAKAKDLVHYLESKGVSHSDDATQAKPIRLVIAEEYPAQMAKGEAALVTLVADNSDEKLQKSIRRLQALLQQYSAEMGSLRLIARGIDPRVVQPLNVELQDEATADSKGGMILGLAIFTMIYSVFISGMNLAIDTSAGERERNSLALLLSHPISTRELVWSKILAVTGFAILGVVLILLVSKFAYAMVPWQELGFAINLDPRFMLVMLLVALPVALLAASLELAVSFMAKTFKEAQSYLTMVLFVPLALAMASTYQIAPDVLAWLPISGQQQALMELVKGKDLPMMQLLATSAGTLAIALVLAFTMERSLKSEKVVFGL